MVKQVMGTTLIFLHHNGHWIDLQIYTDYDVCGIVVNNDCSFSVLCDIIADKLKINLADKNLIIKYQVKEAYPSVEIETDSSLKFYLELKQREPDFTKFPLCITITRKEVSNFAVMEHEHNCHVQPLSFMKPGFKFGSNKCKEKILDFAQSATNVMLAQAEHTAAQLENSTKSGCVGISVPVIKCSAYDATNNPESLNKHDKYKI
ncbi:adenylosuccinate synthetase [Striga asiatica]|uniref:Adenylosuccinate synthetase n=1 Tax=Striga asiatica TaxID=4170 RepID=A0A5A7NW23_STRAF|nr:adenylosuccinate synthetase [Striga asiatica]